MKTKFNLLALAVLAVLSTINYQLSTLHAQGTAFTYQGRLNSAGNPANGSYDLTFALFTDSGGVNQNGATLTNSAVGVTNGLFTVTLDFGPGIFYGESLWLEIGVETNGGGGSFTALSPLQQLTPAPYAIYSATANSATSAGVASSVVPGTVTGAGIASGSVVKSLNGLHDAVTLSAGTNITITPSGNTLTIASSAGGGGGVGTNSWSLTGNAGTSPASGNFVGTTDFNPLELWVNDTRALHLEPTPNDANHSGIVNVVGGASVNFAGSGVYGATVAGGGAVNYLGSSYVSSVNADFGSVGGGGGNTIQTGAIESTIGGGFVNTIGANAGSSTIAGGYFNKIQTGAYYSTMAGGYENTIETNSNDSTIGGGFENTIQINASESTIAGGYQNVINGSGSTIGGGFQNTNSGVGAFIGGGGENIVYGGESVIGGGLENQVNAPYSIVGGGLYNTIGVSAVYATVGGGYSNTAAGPGAFVGGGGYDGTSIAGNTASGNASTIGGGLGNQANGQDSVVGGGAENQASGDGSVVGGGGYDGTSTVGNTASGDASTVAGGLGNQAGGPYATIGGGFFNVSSSSAAIDTTISGGNQNNITGVNASFATIGGGFANNIIVDGYGAVIGGGMQNTNTGNYGTISGGYSNHVNATYATVPGGYGNNVNGQASFAAGQNATCNNNNSFVWGDGSGAAGDRQAKSFNVLATGGFYFYSGPGGAELEPNATSWTVISDRNAKKNFQPVDTVAVLNKLAAVPIEQWNYKWEKDSDTPNIGPMAQDFKAAFYPGRDDKGITTLEFDGVELAAIQGLNQKLEAGDQKSEAGIQKAETQIEELNTENAELKRRNASLEKRLEALEQIVLKQKQN